MRRPLCKMRPDDGFSFATLRQVKTPMQVGHVNSVFIQSKLLLGRPAVAYSARSIRASATN